MSRSLLILCGLSITILTLRLATVDGMSGLLKATPSSTQLPADSHSALDGQVDWNQVSKWRKDGSRVLLVDARARSSWELNHPEGAVSLDPHGDMAAQVFDLVSRGAFSQLDHLVIYCDKQSCQASETVRAQILDQLGPALEAQSIQIWILSGGFESIHPLGN